MSRSKTILHFNIAGSSQNSINRLADAEKAVVKRVNQLIEQYCQGTKFCDPEFGPNDSDEYGTKSLYRDGKAPQSSGSNAYPEPQRLQWVRPKYSYGNETSNDDEENEFDDGFDDEFDDDEFGDNFSDEEEDLCTEGKLFQDGHSCQDVIQGKLGDCWFLGALAVLATQPLFLENIFFSGDPNQNINQRWLDCGLWVCRFKKNFEYYYVIIDDRIPVYSNSKSKAPVFARCRDENELWVPLIEKAFAKLNGSYDSLIGGYIDCALRDLTGLCSQLLVLQPGHTGYNEDTGHLVENGELFKLIQRRTEDGTLCGCSIQPKGGQTCQAEANIGEGLKMKHAYSIIGVCEIKLNKNKTQKLIMLRNPWGNGEWSGEWSDDSDMKEKYIDQIKEAFMNRKIAKNTGLTAASVAGGVDETNNDVEDLFDNKNDGVFLMSFEDWLKYYTHLFFCINFPDEYRGWRVSGEWRNDNSGGNPSCTTWSINPQYKFSLTEQTNNVVIQLTQEDLRETYGRTVVSHNNVIGFHIVPANFNFSDRKARPPQIIPGTSDVLQPTYTFHDASTISINMAAGDYILVPSTYERGKLEEAEVIAEEEEVEFDDNDDNDKTSKPIQESFTFNKRRYEEAKDHLLEVCKQRNINVTNILNSLSNVSQDELNRPMKIREFREKLASYGIKAMDLTDDQLRPLSGEDGIFELSDILDIFKSEKEIQDINNLQEQVSKDVDDLEYASIVTDGEIGITIKQIRDLPLDSNTSKQKVQPEDFITWTRNDKFRKLIKNYNYSETFLFSFYQKLLYVIRSIESDSPIDTFIECFPVLTDQQFGITSTEEELAETIKQIKNEFVPFGIIVTSIEIYIFLTGLMKYKWSTVMELITLMFNTSSNFDNNNDNDTTHENAEDSELMSPQTPSTAQDTVTKIDTNASKIHSNSTFAEFENLRCSGLHKLHKFASGNNNVIYCVHCDTLLEDKYYACKGKKCNNYFCENCYKDIPNGLCDTCYASEQNRINLMHKKLHQIKKSSKKAFVVQTYKQEEIENKFEENEKAKTWINGTVFSLFQDSWRILKTRKLISEHNPYDRLNKEILPNKYPIYQRLRNVRRIQEYQGLSFNIQNNEALESIFEALDTDHSGELSFTEFRNGCESLGFDLSDKECRVVFQKFDTSGDSSIGSIEYKEFVDYLYGNQNKKLIRSMFLLAKAYHKYRYISSYLTDINNPNPVKFKELLSKENIETSKDNVNKLLFLFNYNSETFIETFKDFTRLRGVGDLVDQVTQELADSISKIVSDVFNDEDCNTFWQKICINCDELSGSKSFTEINKREYPVTIFMIGFLKCLDFSDNEDSVLKKYFVYDEENIEEYKQHVNLVSEDGLGYCLFILRLLFIKYGLSNPTINYKDFRFILYNPIMNSIELRIRLRLKILISQLTNTEQFLVNAEYEINHSNNDKNNDNNENNKSDLIHIRLHDISTGETLETSVSQKVVNYIPPCGLNKEYEDALINQQCCPVESEALESLISCLEIRVNPETGKNSLVLKECERFINEIQNYFESSAIPFDFFMNISQSEIKFIRELDETGTRGLRHNILESVRKNKQLTLQLCNMSRRLDVIFESTGEESIYRETMSWSDFVDYLVGNRNPTYFLTVEPDLENNYSTYYGPILEDGGSSINVDKSYIISYESDKSNKKCLYNDCVTIGNKYYIVSLINNNNKREIVVYDSQLASPVKVVKDVHVEELPEDIDDDNFEKIWNSKINLLELGESVSPYINISFNNGKNHLGVCKISIDSIISNDGCDLKEWYTIYNGDKKCGSVLIECTFLSKDRLEEVVIDYEKENLNYQNKLKKYISKKEVPKSISDIDGRVIPKRMSVMKSKQQQQQQDEEDNNAIRSRKPSIRKSRTQTPNTRSRRNSSTTGSTRTPTGNRMSKTPRNSISPNKPQIIEEQQQQQQTIPPPPQIQQQQPIAQPLAQSVDKKKKVNELVNNRDVALLLSELKRSKDCFDISLKEKKLNSVISKLIIMLNPTNPDSIEKVKITPTVVSRKHKVGGVSSSSVAPPAPSSSGDMSVGNSVNKPRKSLKPSTTKSSTLKSTPVRKPIGSSVGVNSSGKKKTVLKKKTATK